MFADTDDVTSDGRLFQVLAAATGTLTRFLEFCSLLI